MIYTLKRPKNIFIYLPIKLVPSLSETNLKSQVSKIVPKDQVQSLAIHLSLLLSQLQSLAFLSDMKLWYPWIVRGYGLQLDHCNQEWEIDLRLRGQGQKLDHWPGTESSFIFRVEELENDLMLRSLRFGLGFGVKGLGNNSSLRWQGLNFNCCDLVTDQELEFG